jgi:hypothetical protein
MSPSLANRIKNNILATKYSCPPPRSELARIFFGKNIFEQENTFFFSAK